MKDELKAKLIATDAKNPLKLTTDEINKRIQEVCTAWYNRQSKCEVVAYPAHFMPCYGYKINGLPMFPFQSVVVVNDGSGWKHAVDINISTTRELLPPEREPDGRITRTPLYMVSSIDLDFNRAGREALEPRRPTGR
jgi:hypothetical protein